MLNRSDGRSIAANTKSRSQDTGCPSIVSLRVARSASARILRVWFAVVLVATASCAQQPDPNASLPPGDLTLGSQVAGFVVGLFHGFMIVFNMIASLVFNVRIYSFPNSGRLYDLGYVVGAAAFFEMTTTRRSDGGRLRRLRRGPLPGNGGPLLRRRRDQSNRMYGDTGERF